jgi:exosortase
MSLQQYDIRTVVLVGGCDFGRCSLAKRLPTAMWPVAGKPALERLLDHLAAGGLTEVVICCSSEVSALVAQVRRPKSLQVRLMAEDLTCGTGGCLRDAVANDPGEVILMLSASLVEPPSVSNLVEAHRSGGATLSVVFNPALSDEDVTGSSAEIYLCQPDVLNHVPVAGYSDIKEGLIPSLLRAGASVRPVVLQQAVGNFHDRAGYLEAVCMYLGNHESAPGVGAGAGTERGSIDKTARVYGPVSIAEGARILADAVVIGPASLDRDACVGPGSTVVRSALWHNATVGAGCTVSDCVVDGDAAVPDGCVVAERSISIEDKPAGVGWARRRRARMRGGFDRFTGSLRALWQRSVDRLPNWARAAPTQMAAYGVGGAAVLAALMWSYWPTLTDLHRVWMRSDEYSAGLLVPFLALYVLWVRRGDFSSVSVKPAVFWGIVAFLLAQAVRGAGLYFLYGSGMRISLVLTVVALVLLILGWHVLRRAWPILLFLCLMLPWPNRVQAAVALPLQRWATSSAVFCLELTGNEVVQDGNVIHIGGESVAVAEACNGLRMVTAFFVISGLVALLVRRAWWEKLIVLVSSFPIALLCNTVRLWMTSIAFTRLDGETWKQMFHDYGGFAMMPLALAMVVGELWLLTQLTTPPTEAEPVIVARRKPRHIADS